MSTNTIESENSAAAETPQPKGKSAAPKKSTPAKKAGRAKKPTGKPHAERATRRPRSLP